MTIDKALSQLLNTAFRDGVEQLAGPLPAVVQAYTASPRPIADVVPAINITTRGKEVKAPTLLDVPVAWLGDGASYAITWPLVQGSVVGLVPQGADISQWYANGTVGLPAPSERRFDLADVIALPAPPWRATPANAVDSAAMVLFANLVKLGDASASDFVALASKVLTELGKIETAYNTHTHPTAPDGPPSPPSATYTKASVAAAKVQAK